MTSFDAEVKVSVPCDNCASKETCALSADVRKAVAEMPPRVFRSEVVNVDPLTTQTRHTLVVSPIVYCAFATSRLPRIFGVACGMAPAQVFAQQPSNN